MLEGCMLLLELKRFWQMPCPVSIWVLKQIYIYIDIRQIWIKIWLLFSRQNIYCDIWYITYMMKSFRIIKTPCVSPSHPCLELGNCWSFKIIKAGDQGSPTPRPQKGPRSLRRWATQQEVSCRRASEQSFLRIYSRSPLLVFNYHLATGQAQGSPWFCIMVSCRITSLYITM